MCKGGVLTSAENLLNMNCMHALNMVRTVVNQVLPSDPISKISILYMAASTVPSPSPSLSPSPSPTPTPTPSPTPSILVGDIKALCALVNGIVSTGVHCYKVDPSAVTMTGLNSPNYPLPSSVDVLGSYPQGSTLDIASDDQNVFCYVVAHPTTGTYCGCLDFWTKATSRLDACSLVMGVYEARVLVGSRYACFVLAFENFGNAGVSLFCSEKGLRKTDATMSYSPQGNLKPPNSMAPLLDAVLNELNQTVCLVVAFSSQTYGSCVDVDLNYNFFGSVLSLEPAAARVISNKNSPYIAFIYDVSNSSSDNLQLTRVHVAIPTITVSTSGNPTVLGKIQSLSAAFAPDDETICAAYSNGINSTIQCFNISNPTILSYSLDFSGANWAFSSIVIASNSKFFCAAMGNTGFNMKVCHSTTNSTTALPQLNPSPTALYAFKGTNGAQYFSEVSLTGSPLSAIVYLTDESGVRKFVNEFNRSGDPFTHVDSMILKDDVVHCFFFSFTLFISFEMEAIFLVYFLAMQWSQHERQHLFCLFFALNVWSSGQAR